MVSVRRFVEFCVELYVLLHGLGFIGLNPKPYPTEVTGLHKKHCQH